MAWELCMIQCPLFTDEDYLPFPSLLRSLNKIALLLSNCLHFVGGVISVLSMDIH
jgi:hypothetical protein